MDQTISLKTTLEEESLIDQVPETIGHSNTGSVEVMVIINLNAQLI